MDWGDKIFIRSAACTDPKLENPSDLRRIQVESCFTCKSGGSARIETEQSLNNSSSQSEILTERILNK